MPPDDETSLKAAFRALHGRERAEAPPFETMRGRVLNAANGRQSSRPEIVGRWLVWGVPTIGCAAALFLWMSGRLTTPAPEVSPTQTPQVASTEHVEQLLNSIERQMEAGEVAASPVYATDALLTQIDTSLTP